MTKSALGKSEDISHFKRLGALEASMASRYPFAIRVVLAVIGAGVIFYLAGPVFNILPGNVAAWGAMAVFFVIFGIILGLSRAWPAPRCPECRKRMQKIYVPTQQQSEKLYLVCYDCKTKACASIESTG